MKINELEYFRRLSHEDKSKLIFSTGAILGIRENCNQRKELYCLGSFFAEVWFSPGGELIQRIDTFFGEDKRIDHYISSDIPI